MTDSAPRRTFLAAERTYLAWLRTGLGAIGVSLAVGRVIPALIQGSSDLGFTVLGVAYGVLGLFLIGSAALRMRHIRRALEDNAPLPQDRWALTVTTLLALVLGLFTIALVVVAF